MRIESVKLNNVRSYLSEQIRFPEGSLLLSGDIGSGKSTILYAIEFALFGFVGNLKGGSLLRKGKPAGWVEVALDVDGRKITINRTLKRSRDSVNQGLGFIAIDGVKTDCTAKELKARILELLGYPETLLDKSKELIYRYTVYTPQDEMKAILFNDAAARLDTLRKVFQIDKYKAIRDNSPVISSLLKEKIAGLSAKTENIPEKKKLLEDAAKKQTDKRADLGLLAPLIADTERKMALDKSLLKSYEADLKSFNALKVKLSEYGTGITEKNRTLEILLRERKSTEGQIGDCRASLSDSKKIESDFGHKLGILSHHVSRLDNETGAEESVKLEISGIERNLGIISEELSKAQAATSESKKLERNVLASDSCPVCLQPIAEQHKEHFRKKISAELLDSGRIATEKGAEKESLNARLAATREKRDVIIEQQRKLAGLSPLAKQFTDYSLESGITIREFDNRTYDVREVVVSLASCRKALEDARALKSGIAEKTSRLKTLDERISEATAEIKGLAAKKSAIEQELQKHSSLQSESDRVKSRLETLQQTEKELLVKKAGLERELENLDGTAALLSIEIAEKEADKKILDRTHQLKNWIDELFANLMDAIERSVMQKIHGEFDDLFRDWFNVLIEDETISAGLDDSFTPVVDINGYGVSLNSLSGGEKTSCALAYRLALNRAINDVSSTIKTSDVLMLDEPTDGFSSHQLEKVRDVLEQLNLPQVILVSHEPKVESFVRNVFRIFKEQHVSRVVC